MGIKLKITISLLTLTILYGGYYFGIPAILNRPDNSRFFSEYVEKEYGFKTDIKNPHVKMGILPAVWIRADEFSVLNNDKSKALNIQNINSKIKLLPLIFSKVEISQFSADNLDVDLIFDKNSKLKLGQYPIISISNPRVTVEKAVVEIGKYKVNLFDEVKNKNIVLNGDYFTLYDFVDNKRVKFSTDAHLAVGKKTSSIKANVDMKLPLSRVSEDKLQIEGEISNLDLADFSTYAKSISGNKIQKLSGILNLTASTTFTENNEKKINGLLTLDNLEIMQEELASSIYSKDRLTVATEMSLIQNGVYLREMTIKSKGVDAMVTGVIRNPNSKNPNLNMKITLNKSRIENITPLLPGEKELSPDINLYLLKKYGYYGDIIGNLDIKGNPEQPSITGNILSTNGYLIRPLPDNAPKATVKIKFLGNKSSIDVKVPVNHTQTVFVKGDTLLYGDKATDLSINTTPSIDLHLAQTVLNPLHEILNFDLGPIPIMEISGRGSVNMHIVGSKKDPHVWGAFNFVDTTASFVDIHNLKLEKAHGRLTFDDRNTHFLTHSAVLNGKPVVVDGTCTLFGILDFKVSTQDQNTEDLLKVVRTSPMLKDIQGMIAPIKSSSGKSDLKINITGQVRNALDITFNKNIFAKGEIKLDSNDIEISQLPAALKNVSGLVKFDNFDIDYNLTSSLSNSQISTSGKIKNSILDTKVTSNRFNLSDAIKLAAPAGKKIPFAKDLSTINTSFTAYYKGPIDKINHDEITINGKIYSNKGSKSTILLDNGTFSLNKSNFKLSTLRGTFRKNPYTISTDIARIFSNERDINGSFSMKNFNLSFLEDIKSLQILPSSFKNEDIRDLSGIININAQMRHNNLNLFTKLDGTSLTYVPKKMKIKISSGNILLRNDELALNKVNAFMGEMPLFIDGKVSNIYKNPNLNLYINAKPTQEFFDQFFNNKAVYPIKMKGDVICTSRISGTKDRLNARTALKIEENSSLYYMGATLGDISNPVEIYLDNIYTPTWMRINNFKYDKIISSQNNKNFANTQLLASGTMEFLPNHNVGFRNFRVKTQSPTDAKIFNLIFRKPLMKQGVFTSDLVINGTSFAPRILGKLDVTSIDMPFFDATVKDVNLDFKNDKILITSRGVILTNSVNISAVMKNDLTFPYVFENIKLKLKDLDINKITDSIRDFEADMYRSKNSAAKTETLNLSQIIVKKAEVEADTINVRNIHAQDFTANLSFDEKMVLNIDKFKFKLAEGYVNGSWKYDFVTNRVNLLMHMKDSNAQIISEALFDLQNQIYGSITGDITLSCNAKSHESCTKSLQGNGYFIVANGKMPKLGSLEYLLKAGNLLRGGFTGLSISSLVDLITPLKTGEFDSISGNIQISDGIAQNLNIYSNGKDLNMYLKGSYNFSNSIADMNVFGTLSNNLTSVLGKVKNVSLNTLLNTIPLVNKTELSPSTLAEINKIPNIDTQNIYKVFAVEIYGDINGTDYVRSFKWIK